MAPFTGLLEKVRQGDEEATIDLANHFSRIAIAFARTCLPTSPTSSVDHDDIANSALKSFFVRLQDGRLEYLGDRQLVAALRKIVKAKTSRLFEMYLSEKRDVRRLLPNESIDLLPREPDLPSLGFLMGEDWDLDIDQADQLAVKRILQSLQQDLHGLFKSLAAALDVFPRKVLFLMLEAELSNEQLAERLGRSVASIERYRKLIREKLQEIHDESS